MNESRRGEIKSVIGNIYGLQITVMTAKEGWWEEKSTEYGYEDGNNREYVVAAIEDMADDLDGIINDEQEYYDNMPEAIRNGEKGDWSSEAIDALTAARQYLEDWKNEPEDHHVGDEAISKMEEVV